MEASTEEVETGAALDAATVEDKVMEAIMEE